MIITRKPQEIVRVMIRLISEKILQQVSSNNIKKKKGTNSLQKILETYP